MIVWEEDQDHLATILVKARVSGLDAIPWFFNFTEGSDPESDCWTAQCEILMTRLLGAQAQDEDFPPEDPDDVDPNNFDFHGFGQLVHPGHGPNGPLIPQNANAADGLNVAWAPWPQNADDLNMAAQVQNQIAGNNLAEAQEEAPLLIPLQPDPVVEEIINLPGLEQQQVELEIQQEQVLAMNDLTDADSDVEQPQVQLSVPQWRLFLFLISTTCSL